MTRRYLPVWFFAAAAILVVSTMAQEHRPSVNSSTATSDNGGKGASASGRPTHSPNPSKTAQATESDASDRVEGEKRFRTNCGRCHMPPHKFAPRVMATAIRHMRVRAMITDEDMRLILRYMTE